MYVAGCDEAIKIALNDKQAFESAAGIEIALEDAVCTALKHIEAQRKGAEVFAVSFRAAIPVGWMMKNCWHGFDKPSRSRVAECADEARRHSEKTAVSVHADKCVDVIDDGRLTCKVGEGQNSCDVVKTRLCGR